MKGSGLEVARCSTCRLIKFSWVILLLAVEGEEDSRIERLRSCGVPCVVIKDQAARGRTVWKGHLDAQEVAAGMDWEVGNRQPK